jgi:uncharacterized UPF0160 family protein
MEKIKIVATHDCKFHSDEVFAIAILKKVYGEFEVIRTRDPDILKKADIRVDVGGAYNLETNDFDHHQNDFKETGESGIPYSSCGLIWKNFGRKLVNSEEAFKRITKRIIEFLDAQDTGVDYSLGNVQVYGLGQAIDSFYPSWKDEEDVNKQFEKAVDFATIILDNEIRKSNDYKEGLEIVRNAIKENSNKGFIILGEVGLPKGQMVEETDLLYVVSRRPDGNWNSIAIRDKVDSFENRKDFPKEWAGLTHEDLEKVSGVKGAVFCHKNLFMCACKTKEGIIEMTKKAVEA